MKVSEKIMGMNCTIEILDEVTNQTIDEILEFFYYIDNTFSTYKKNSEISKFNRKLIDQKDLLPIVRKVLLLCEETKEMTHNYFDIKIENHKDPAGLLCGYAINESSKRLLHAGYKNFHIGLGQDIEIHGLKNGMKWKVGLQNPVTKVKPYILNLTNKGISTSGMNQTGIPIYNPITKKIANSFALVTIIAPNSFEADRSATASYAMGDKALNFIEEHDFLEAYIVFRDGKEFMTRGMRSYL